MKKAIGIMSGTSLDGIDLVYATISGENLNIKVDVIESMTLPIDENIKSKIIDAMDDTKANLPLITSLNVELGMVFADAVLTFARQHQINLNDIDFIASHGQTIYHISEQKGELVPSSLQLGDGSVIAHFTQTKVISNFRNSDIASGGQGAPLVPFADYILFRNQDKNIAIHNIGGIANMTYLKKDGLLDDVIAFDSGPGNVMINEACQKLYDLAFDEDGLIASKGHMILPLYKTVMAHPYFNRDYPKSTGREDFGKPYVDHLIKQFEQYSHEDIIHTLSMVTVDSIVDSYKTLIEKPLDELILCGGGAKNRFIKSEIEKKLKPVKVKVLDDLGFNSDYKEALAFIILGYQTLKGEPSNVKHATGASKYKILGQISLP